MRVPSLTAAAGALLLLAAGAPVAGAATGTGPGGPPTAPRTAAASQPSAGPSAGPSSGPGPRWAPCDAQSLAGVQCSTVRVPVDRADPRGEQIDLRLGRFPATGQSEGSLLLIPGGPGAGLEAMNGLAPMLRVKELTKRYDVVTFDPRGVGASAPVACALPDPPRTTDVPSRAAFDRLATNHAAFADSCRTATGDRLDHLSAVDTADDIEAIRRALGEGGLVAYGGSYGTNYGGAYLERYGHRVKALVLDAVVDHSVSLSVFAARNARGVEDAFGRFTAWCDRDTSCALHGEDVTGIVDDLASRTSLPAPGAPRPVSGIDVTMTLGDLFSAGAHPDMGWPHLARSLRQAKDGDASAFASGPPSGRGLFRGVLCADFGAQKSYREHAAMADRLSREAPRFGASRYWSIVSECVGWDRPATNRPHRLDVGKHPRVLVASNTHDPATPLSNALAVHRQIPRSKLLVADADGHQTLVFSRPGFDVITRFLGDPSSVGRYTYVTG
ncbi:alpha/beta fold hydrolase [Streptomyces sp. NPDC055078]